MRHADPNLRTLLSVSALLMVFLLRPAAIQAEKPQPGIYDVSYDVVYDKCIEVFGRLGWNITAFDQANGYITANTGINFSTMGDVVNVVISPTSSGEITVILSSTTPGQPITWGKNKRNKKKFYKLLDEIIAEAETRGEAIERSPSMTRKVEESRDPLPSGTGSGFFITRNGYLLTNYHVIDGGQRFSIYVGDDILPATYVNGDKINDIALLKVEALVKPVPIIESRTILLASEVFTIGFPMPGDQGLSPKFTRGEISSVFGLQDDVRFFQISTPVQPGNSGGALFDDAGNVIGMTTATLDSLSRLRSTGTTPQNVNYALKSDYIIAFLKNFPDVYSRLENAQDRNYLNMSEIVAEVLQSAVLVVRF